MSSSTSTADTVRITRTGLPYPSVFCPHCRGRYIGAFVGRGQCASCKAWVDVPVDRAASVID